MRPRRAPGLRSCHAPLPLSELERAVLIAAATGITGWHFGIPYSPAERPDGYSYTPGYTGHPFPAGAGIHTSELFLTDNSGSYMVKLRQAQPERLREVAQVEDLEHMLARWQGTSRAEACGGEGLSSTGGESNAIVVSGH